jgi:hypothetical protein
MNRVLPKMNRVQPKMNRVQPKVSRAQPKNVPELAELCSFLGDPDTFLGVSRYILAHPGSFLAGLGLFFG